jgi:o-succinylbenzoate---CoA ligase
VVSVPNPLESAAIARPETPAIHVDGRAIPYRELADRVARRAGALGARSGERVLIDGSLDLAWVVELHAALWCGAVAAPLDPRATPFERGAAIRALAPASQPPPGVARAASPTPWALEQPLVALRTSGSTGPAQIVELTAAQVLFSAFGSLVRLGHALDDRWLLCLPPHHVGGLSILVRAALAAVAVELQPDFEPTRIAARMDSGEISLVSLTPALLRQVLDARAARPFPSALRAILLGGGPAPEALLARCQSLDVPVARTWGMTEAASQICTTAPGVYGGSLPPLPFARVTAEADALVVHGPLVRGRRQTTDLGRVTAGCVDVLGRADAVIVSGGAKIDPAEVEAVVGAHPGVTDCAVVGLPHLRWGHRPVALVVGPVEGLRARCRAHLRPHKVPDAFLSVDAIGGAGPLDKRGPALLRRLVREHPQWAQAVEESGGQLGRAEVRQAHAGVDERHHDAQVVGVVSAAELVPEGHGATTHGRHRGAGHQSVPVANGGRVVGLGVDDGERHAQLGEDAIHAPEAGGEQLLETDMRVLEGAPEECDADAIHLVEAGGERMLKGHRRSREGQG